MHAAITIFNETHPPDLKHSNTLLLLTDVYLRGLDAGRGLGRKNE
jgi:hypothetical protein